MSHKSGILSLLARIGVLLGVLALFLLVEWPVAKASTLWLETPPAERVSPNAPQAQSCTQSSCHGQMEFTANSHHVVSSISETDCKVCHAEVDGNANHQDGLVHLLDPDSGAVSTVTRISGNRASLTAGDIALLNAFCQNCHDSNGAARLANPYDPFGDGISAIPTVGTHSNQGFVGAAEAPFYVGCIQCHVSHGSNNESLIASAVVVTPSLTSGPVVFTSSTGENSYDENSGDADDTDDICTTCHVNSNNSGYPMHDHVGGDHSAVGGDDTRGTDCTICHRHDPDTNPATQNGYMPNNGTNCIACHDTAQDEAGVGPNGVRHSVMNDFMAVSHHITGTLTNNDCLICHLVETSGNNHKNGLVQLTDPDNAATTYTESSAGTYRPEGLTSGDVTALTTFCRNCHDSNGAARLGTSAYSPFSDGVNVKAVGTHSNQDFSGVEEDFYVGCAQCHTSHGSSNLALIHNQVVIVPGVMSGTVVFTAQTGAGSRDDGSGNGICVICHTHSSNPGYEMTNHSGGLHTRPSVGDQRNNDCSTCHPHEPDGNPASLNGHMPAGPTAVGLYGIFAQGGLWSVLGLVGVLCAVTLEQRKHR